MLLLLFHPILPTKMSMINFDIEMMEMVRVFKTDPSKLVFAMRIVKGTEYELNRYLDAIARDIIACDFESIKTSWIPKQSDFYTKWCKDAFIRDAGYVVTPYDDLTGIGGIAEEALNDRNMFKREVYGARDCFIANTTLTPLETDALKTALASAELPKDIETALQTIINHSLISPDMDEGIIPEPRDITDVVREMNRAITDILIAEDIEYSDPDMVISTNTVDIRPM